MKTKRKILWVQFLRHFRWLQDVFFWNSLVEYVKMQLLVKKKPIDLTVIQIENPVIQPSFKEKIHRFDSHSKRKSTGSVVIQRWKPTDSTMIQRNNPLIQSWKSSLYKMRYSWANQMIEPVSYQVCRGNWFKWLSLHSSCQGVVIYWSAVHGWGEQQWRGFKWYWWAGQEPGEHAGQQENRCTGTYWLYCTLCCIYIGSCFKIVLWKSLWSGLVFFKADEGQWAIHTHSLQLTFGIFSQLVRNSSCCLRDTEGRSKHVMWSLG